AGQRIPVLRDLDKYWNYDPKGKLINEFFSSLDPITPATDDVAIEKLRIPTEGPPEPNVNPYNAPGDRFMDPGNDALLAEEYAKYAGSDQNRNGLPVVVILNTVERILQKDYNKVDFSNALTALDYLRDLELTRRAKLRTAAERLGITLETWRAVLTDNPDALKWIELIQKYELIIEEGYANIFIDLRIWTMISELKSDHFHKPSVLALLNTLFPPTATVLPNNRIPPKVLNQYRSSLYRYITAVEANGPSVMKAFEAKLQAESNRHSWKSTWENLQLYMWLAELMIKQAEVAIDL
ncbi:hypothetical protein NA56DRAFT_545259, partial [Hyaloscypha hepaticicola]